MNIITALNNPRLSKKIKEKTNFSIIGTDIQYKEGIIEMLEKNGEIEMAIISENLPGESSFKELIEKIKAINKNIELIVILKEEKEDLKNYLITKGVFDIYLNNKISIEELIEKINEKNKIKKEMEINEEIKQLKKIILEKNKKNTNIKIIKNKLNNIIKKINKNKKVKKEKINKKIISVIGTGGVGKSSFCTIFAKLFNNKRILIIDFDILNSSINSIFGIKKKPIKKNNIKFNNNIKNLIVKVDKKIDMLCATKILVDEKYKKIKEEFSNILLELKNKYDLIIIDNSSECFFEYTKEILNKSDTIFFLVEPNVIELKKSRNLLDIYINKWKIKKEKINIIFNKININSIDDKILKTIFSDFKILGKIKININYNLIINRNFKFINKKIKKDYLKIIKNCNLCEGDFVGAYCIRPKTNLLEML